MSKLSFLSQPAFLISSFPLPTSHRTLKSTRRKFPRCSTDKPPAPLQRPAPATLARRYPNVPTLFTRPEAVLGALIAAAALLTDFARGLSQVISRAQEGRDREMSTRLEEVDGSIASLQTALDSSKALLTEMEDKLDESLARATSAESALEAMGREKNKLKQTLDRAAEAEREIAKMEELLKLERKKNEVAEEEVRKKEEEILEIEKREDVKKVEREMEVVKGEMGELKVELKERDRVVNEVVKECDELKSLLAVREAELQEVHEKLKSAMHGEEGEGANVGGSKGKLEEIRDDLEVEQLVKVAEIKRAEIRERELIGDDELELVKDVVGVEEELLQAGLKRARNRMNVVEEDRKRKDEAVEGILESIRGEQVEVRGEAMTEEELGQPVAELMDEEMTGSRSVPLENVLYGTEVGATKQAQSSAVESDVKPKKRRGRPPKAKSSDDTTQAEKPKRKRGRPRKSPSAE